MSTSCRFSVALHILTAIALQEGKPVPSEMIADSVASHPTVIRRILSMLNKHKITKAQLGKGGGALLAKPTQSILLLEVHRAVEEDTLFAPHRNTPNTQCMVGRNISAALNQTLAPIRESFEQSLSAISLQTVVENLLKHGEINGGLFIRL